MLTNIKSKVSSIPNYFIGLLLLGLVYTIIYNISTPNYEIIKVIGFIALFQLLYTLYTWYKIKESC